VTAVTEAGPCGALRMTWVTWTPPSAEDTTTGMSPAPPVATPPATRRPAWSTATELSIALVAPDGLARSYSVQCWPSAESQIVWQPAMEPTATKPLFTAAAAVAFAGVPVPVALIQFFRSADHQKAARSLAPLPCLPTTRYPPGPAATPRNCAPAPAMPVRAGSGDHATPSGDQKTTGSSVPFSFADPTAIQPDVSLATAVRFPVSPPRAAVDTSDQVPLGACRHTAGWASA